jgi:hypothetical protein
VLGNKRVRWLVPIKRLPTKYDSVQTRFSGQVKLAKDCIGYAAEITGYKKLV